MTLGGMTVALTPQQQTFIDNYLSNKRFNKKKTRERYEKFATAYNATKEFIGLLGDNDPEKANLTAALELARTHTEDDHNFKVGKEEARRVEQKARLAINGYVNAYSTQDMDQRLANAQNLLRQSKQEIDAPIKVMVDNIAALKGGHSVAKCNDIRDALNFRNAFVAVETLVTADFSSAVSKLSNAIGDMENRAVPALMQVLEREIETVRKAGREAEFAQQIRAYEQFKAEANGAQGLYLKTATGRTLRDGYKEDFKKALFDVKDMSKFKSDLSNQDVADAEEARMTSGEIAPDVLWHGMETDGEDGMPTSVFIRLAAENEARVEAARKRMREDGVLDKGLVRGKDDDRREFDPVVAEELDRFDSVAVFKNTIGGGRLPRKPSPQEATQARDDVKNKIRQHMQGIDPKSEEYLDLVTMDRAALIRDLADAAWIPGDFQGVEPELKTLIEQMADDMRAEIIANSPNKMAADGNSLNFGGKAYNVGELLGQGGNGKASRFTAADGTSIIVKSLLMGDGGDDEQARAKLEAKRAEMVQEMQTHARAQKGNTQSSKENIATMEGAALGDDGMLHMILKDEGGSDLNNVASAMQLMTTSGMIPEEARAVLAQESTKQLVQGLKFMEEKNLIHNDIKPGNMVMTSDGTVKIIDFGESRFGDDKGEIATGGYQTTGEYEAEENFKKDKVDSSVDTHALGGVIQALAGRRGEFPVLRPGKFWNSEVREKEKNAGNLGEDETQNPGAMDRLVSSTMAKDAENRPSLEAIATSAYMTAGAGKDFVKADIDDLKAASAKMIERLKIVKANFADGELGLTNSGHPMPGRELDATGIQNALNEAEGEIERRQAIAQKKKEKVITLADVNEIVKKDGEDALNSDQKKIYDLGQTAALIRQKRDSAMDAKLAEGAADYDAMVSDKNRKIEINDPLNTDTGKREITIKEALNRKGAALKLIDKDRVEFYKRHDAKQALIQEKMEELKLLDYRQIGDAAPINQEIDRLQAELDEDAEKTNRTIGYRLSTIEEVERLIEANLGPDLSEAAALFRANEDLKEIGARFGQVAPRKSAPAPAPDQDPPPKAVDPAAMARKPVIDEIKDKVPQRD